MVRCLARYNRDTKYLPYLHLYKVENRG